MRGLAHVRPQRGHLGVDDVGDVDGVVVVRVRHHPGLGDRPVLEALVGQQLRVRERVPRVRVDRSDRRRARREVVRVARTDPDPVAFGALDQGSLRAYLPDDAADVAPELDGRHEPAVLVAEVAEEPHVRDADRLGRGLLLGAPDPGDLGPGDGRVEATGVAVGAHAVGHLDPGGGPGGHRARGAEVDVVGVGGDDESTLDLGVLQHGDIVGTRLKTGSPSVDHSPWPDPSRSARRPSSRRSSLPSRRQSRRRPGWCPTTRAYGATVDAPAGWERENTCSPTEKKGPRKLRKLLLKTYGPIASNIVRPCSSADSGHEEGRALDWMVNVRVPEQKVIAESFLAWVQAPDAFGNTAAIARRLGVSYLIWNNQTWRPRDGAWTDYNGCSRLKMRWKKYDTSCHRNHVHISFSWDGALARTSFWSGLVACPAPPVTVPSVPAVLTPVSDVPARAADPPAGQQDRRGLPGRSLPGASRRAGRPAGPRPGRRAGVRRGCGHAPAHGDTAGRPLGGPRLDRRGLPCRFDATALGGKGAPLSATVTVPVPTTGVVSLQLAGGMGHLAVDVTGYVVGAAT